MFVPVICRRVEPVQRGNGVDCRVEALVAARARRRALAPYAHERAVGENERREVRIAVGANGPWLACAAVEERRLAWTMPMDDGHAVGMPSSAPSGTLCPSSWKRRRERLDGGAARLRLG